MTEPKPTYTLAAGDVQFYVKPTSNCEGLPLTTLSQLFGGEWSAERFRADSILLKTGEDLTPRFVVGWTDLYGGIPCQLAAYERIGDEDLPAVALVGGNSGLRIMANMDEGAVDPDDHLPPGWGAPVLLVEDFDDIVDKRLRAALDLDTNVPDYEPPDWNAGDDLPAELDFADLAEIARAWPWSTRDALGRWLGHALRTAGIDDKRQRLALQAELADLFGED